MLRKSFLRFCKLLSGHRSHSHRMIWWRKECFFQMAVGGSYSPTIIKMFDAGGGSSKSIAYVSSKTDIQCRRQADEASPYFLGVQSHCWACWPQVFTAISVVLLITSICKHHPVVEYIPLWLVTWMESQISFETQSFINPVIGHEFIWNCTTETENFHGWKSVCWECIW